MKWQFTVRNAYESLVSSNRDMKQGRCCSTSQRSVPFLASLPSGQTDASTSQAHGAEFSQGSHRSHGNAAAVLWSCAGTKQHSSKNIHDKQYLNSSMNAPLWVIHASNDEEICFHFCLANAFYFWA